MFDWQENLMHNVVPAVSYPKVNPDSSKDSAAYMCLLKNELLNAGIEDVKDQTNDGQRAALVQREQKNLFQVDVEP